MNTLERKTIAEWRRVRLITQGELAKLVGVSLTTISAWEGGKQPRYSNIRALAKALEVAPDQIILLESKDLPAAA
jgi:transcriptional regulator with XRE-family HTH domain